MKHILLRLSILLLFLALMLPCMPAMAEEPQETTVELVVDLVKNDTAELPEDVFSLLSDEIGPFYLDDDQIDFNEDKQPDVSVVEPVYEAITKNAGPVVEEGEPEVAKVRFKRLDGADLMTADPAPFETPGLRDDQTGEEYCYSVVFKLVRPTLTINYIYAGGDVVGEPYIKTFAVGAPYEVESPAIEGFTPDKPKVSGTMGTADVTETVTYTANPVHTHTYGDPTWNWAEDYSSATATFTCTANDDTQPPVTATVTHETTAATCTEAGKTVYTAKATFGGKEYKGTKEVTGDPATGHTYGDPTWNWAEDYSSATATFTCTAKDDTQTVDATVTSVTTPATCTAAGKTVYTAKATFGGKEYTGTKEVPGNPASGHNYLFDEWEWAENYKTAKAVFTCQAKDSKITFDATVTSVTTPATCTEDGKIVYTTEEVTYEALSYKGEQTVKLPATGHAYKPVWTWAEDFSSATATFTCENCGDVQTVSTTTITSAPVSAGGTKYTATVKFLDVTYTKDAFDANVPRHKLTINYVAVDGAQVAEPYVAQVAEGESYSVASPKLTHLVTDVPAVQGTMGAEDITVTVTYTEDYCVITFRCDSSTATQTVWRGEATTLIPNPFKIKSGYSFMGWNTAADGSGTAYADGDQIVTQEDMTLYAQLGKLFTLAFVSNGGKGKMDKLKVVGGETIKLPKCAYGPKMDGMAFIGWTLNSNGSGKKYSDESEFTMPMAHTKLYAQWKGKSVNISFKNNGGTGKMGTMKVNIGDTIKLPANAFTHKKGYSFGCWATSKDGSGERYDDEEEIVVKGAATLYAQWKGKEARVKFSGADKIGDITVEIPGTVTLPECQKTKKGYIFTGWKDGNKEVHDPGEKITVWNDMKFTAQWTKAGTIKFHANKGKGSMDPQYGLPGKKVRLTPNAFTRDGYEFAGWNTKKDGTGTSYKDEDSYRFVDTKSVTLYAQWKVKDVKLTLKKLDKLSKSDKKQTLEATLTIDGQPVKGEYVLFSFQGKTKQVKTDDNGVAEYFISQSVLKKLTVGSKVEYSVTYGGHTVTKRVKVVE